MTTEDQATHWRKLKQQAISGEFRLEEDLGQSLAAACEEYISDLEQLKIEANRLGRLSGWGGLDSAKLLRAKFEDKAAGGGGDPDDNAVARLDQHIAIARDQRDTFLAAIGKLQAVDQQNAGDIAAN